MTDNKEKNPVEQAVEENAQNVHTENEHGDATQETTIDNDCACSSHKEEEQADGCGCGC